MSPDKMKKPRLEAVILSLPGLTGLNGQEVSSSFMDEWLEPSLPGNRGAMTSSLANSNLNLAEVPHCFGTPPQEGINTQASSFQMDLLGNCVAYQFSDGQIISVREILYHPYSQLIRSDLLPLLSTIRPAIADHPWVRLLPNDSLPLWGSLRQVELILISILLNASLFRNSSHPNGPDRLWITNSVDRHSKRKAYSINAIQVGSSIPQIWHLSPSATEKSEFDPGSSLLKLIETPTSSRGILFEQFELNPQTLTLLFHPYQRQIELIYHTLPFEVSRNAYEKWTSQSNPSLSFPLYGHTFIHEIAKTIDRKLSHLKFPPLNREGLQFVPSNQIHSEIWIESNGEMRFCRSFELNHHRYRIWNLSPSANSILKGLQGGLGATSEQDNKILAGDRKGIRRDRDLKVLRHSGFFAYLFLEISGFIEDKKSNPQEVSSDFNYFFKNLLNRLGDLLYEIERKSGLIALSASLPLDRVCSPQLIEFLKKYTLKLWEACESSTESIHIQLGEMNMKGGIQSTIEVFRILISCASAQSQGQCFLKPRMSHFSKFCADPHKKENREKSDSGDDVEESETHVQDFIVHSTPTSQLTQELPKKAQIYKLTGNWISTPQLLHALLPLQNEGFRIYYNQLPIGQMTHTDFKPEFYLEERIQSDEESNSTPSNTIDWFELHPKFFFKGVEVSPDILERLSKEGIIEFQGKIFLIQDKNLPTIKRLEAFWAKIHGANLSAISKRKKAPRYLRLPHNQTLELLALRASGVPIRGGARWQKICEFYDSLDQQRPALILPKCVQAELKPYQSKGVQWLLDLYNLGLGGVLADDMGLGKTVQTLTFLELLRNKNEMGPTLIIVPTSLTFNWVSEANRFTPELPVQIFQSRLKSQTSEFLTSHPNSALICTYGLFTEHREFFSKHQWNILIFDEAQNLKNISAKRTTASRSVSAKFKICLTGTPMENHLGEFYSLLDLSVPGSLGELPDFKAKFITPDVLNTEDLKYLKLKIKPLVLRRTKSEILKELPPKIESVVKLPFEQKQEKIYRDIALSWNEKVKSSILNQGESKSQILMLTALLRLRQTCSDPASIPHVKYSESPPKLNVLMEALQEITESGESALVFTQFLHTFTRIKKEMANLKISSFSLHGGTSRAEREKALKSFQDTPNGSVLLMTLKTGGVGLNLVKASYVFHIEPWWNPAVENQASDRAHRLGQLKPVQVYRYLMKESVEEKIEILKERKSSKFNALFSSSETSNELNTEGNFLSQSDFDYLIR